VLSPRLVQAITWQAAKPSVGAAPAAAPAPGLCELLFVHEKERGRPQGGPQCVCVSVVAD